jgi:hypothetical protein
MSQTDKKRRKLAMAIGESFAAVRRRTARSPAWLSLSAPAIKILIELRLRWRHKDNNNGHLFISFAECQSLLDIAPGTAHRAFRELQDKGFIVCTRRGDAGGLNRAVLDNGGFGYSRKATEWALTDEPYNGQPATHAYEKWQPPKKQLRASTSGTMTVPPVELCKPDSSTSGTTEPDFGARHSSTSGIPVSTICKASDRLTTGTDKSEPESRAAPLWAPSTPIRGPQSAARFGPWLVEKANELGVPPEHVADALRVGVDDIRRMTRTDHRGRGLYPWPASQRRKVEAALASWVPDEGSPPN